MAENSAPAVDRSAAKQVLLTAINECRQAAGLKALIFDEAASAAADAHCAEMVELNFTSHWSASGAKPYQRYFDAGCDGHVSENIIGHDAADGKVFETDAKSVQQQMVEAQSSFMAEHEPDDLNKRNTLDWKHTHIGIGVQCTESSFRYVEVYLDRYVELSAPPTTVSTSLLLRGRVVDPDQYGPYALTVYHDAALSPLEAEELRAEDKTGGYPDFGQRQVAVTWPWEMAVEDDGSFSIPVTIPEVAAGQYYFQLYVRGEKGTIPYAEHQAGVSVPSEDTICTTGLIATYSGDTLLASAQDEAAVAPVTALEVLLSDGGDEAKEGEGEEAAGPLEPSVGFERAAVLGKDDAGGTMGELQLCVARGDGDGGGNAPLVDLRVLAAADEADAAAQLPSGFERVGGNLAPLGAGRGPPFVCICVRRAEADDPAPPLTEVAVAYGGAAAALDAAYTSLELPLGGEVPVFVSFKRAGGDVADTDYDDGLALDPGDVLLDEDEEAVVLTRDEAGDEEMTPEELAEAEARAAEAEERRRVAQQLADEEAEREAQEEQLRRALAAAHKQRAMLLKHNAAMQRQLVPLMKSKGDPKASASAADKEVAQAEQEKRFLDALAAVVGEQGALERERARFDRVAMELQGRLDDKEFKAQEISESFKDFKREIAKAAENSRTGKPIPKRIIGQFEATEAGKDQDVERARLKNINLRTQLRKLEAQLRAKEQLAEGLHLIDFEQLKIENQTLNEKIEERSEELHKLRKKTTNTVQILTHVKEKLQFVQVENQALKGRLAELDAALGEERDGLTQLKRDRDGARTENATLRQKQGFANSGLLVKDFDQRKVEMNQLRSRLAELRERHLELNEQMSSMQEELAEGGLLEGV
eukprot:g5888.t1